jgi:cobalt-zinc-cadmium efflux system protein
VVLIVGSVIILTYAIPELFNPSETDAQGMMWLAILGIIVNGAAVLRLKKGTSLNEKAVMLHLLEDVLGWVAVLIGSVVMMFYHAPFLDPLLSILISLFVLFNVYRNLKKSLRVMLQGTPEDVRIEEIEQKLLKIPRVCDVHDCHIWSMDGEYNVLTVHLGLDGNYDLDELKNIRTNVRTALEPYPINHLTVEFEKQGEECNNQDF